MTRDLYSNNIELFDENVTEPMVYELRKYKKYKKSKKKRKKKQKKLQNKEMRKFEKKLKKKLEKKYRKKFEKPKHSLSTEQYEEIIKRLILEIISQKTMKLPNTIRKLDENDMIIDVPSKEVYR